MDYSTTNVVKETSYEHDQVHPNKTKKPLQNITTDISGVKSKALSFVKLPNTQLKRRSEVAKQTSSLLKTSPGSSTDSPQRKTIFKINTDALNEIQENGNAKRKLNFDINHSLKSKKIMYDQQVHIANSNSESSIESDQYEIENIQQKFSKSIESLIESPARRPSTTNIDLKQSVQKHAKEDANFISTHSGTKSNDMTDSIPITKVLSLNNFKDMDDLHISSAAPVNKVSSEENISKQTKSVLKNTFSTSNLNKKKVIFDMDAIQMKSLSASPSQSTTEKSNSPQNYELGLDNLDDEEWDVSRYLLYNK